MNSFVKNTSISTLVTIMVLLSVSGISAVSAAVMTSSSYSIQNDSINFGGAQGNSASYKVEDTFGEVGTGDSSSASYNLYAGYQQMDVVSDITMSAAADVTMSPTLGGITGGTSNGSSATTVTTSGSAGYALYIKASSSPAMQGNSQGDFIDNFTTGVAGIPDFFFLVGSTQAVFGFTPEGTDVAAKYRDDGGGACNTGSSDTVDRCWNAVSTSNELIATRATSNSPAGTVTTIKFRIELGSSTFTVEDTYTATTTLTAVAL